MFYFVFVVLWSFHFFKSEVPKFWQLILVFISTVVIGVLVEIGQGYYTTTRHSDSMDVLANTSGAFFGMVLFYCIFSLQKNKK